MLGGNGALGYLLGTTMRKYIILVAMFFLLGSGAAGANQPNIVLFIGDDHGWDHAGFLDHPFALTPNLDELAESGTVFTNAHNTASTCWPSLRIFFFRDAFCPMDAAAGLHRSCLG